MPWYSTLPSPYGEITLRSEDGCTLGGLWFETQKPETETCLRSDELPLFTMTANWLTRYFLGEAPGTEEIPVNPKGTLFQLRVWEHLRSIPYGQTVSYGQLAGEMGCKSPQAVGQAVGKNPVSILIPCHRVIGANGTLTGYAGGVAIKRALLGLEGAWHGETGNLPSSS